MKEYLSPTEFIDCDHPEILQLTEMIIGNEVDSSQKIIKLFYYIRDKYPYVPFAMDVRKKAMLTSEQVHRESGYCVSKAMLLSSCARAAGIPARVCFFNVRNHLGTGKLEEALKTDLIVFHGASEVFLGKKWVKLVPAFDKSLCERIGVSTIEFNGIDDAIFQEFKPEHDVKVGQLEYMEYTKEYGSFIDFPYELAISELRKHYPSVFDESIPIEKRVLFKYW